MSSPSATLVPKKRPRISRQAKQQAISGWLFSAPFFVLFCFVFLGPIGTSIYNSFFAERSSGGAYGKKQTTFVGLENFATAATDGRFWGGMGRVFLFGAIQIPIMIFGAMFLALLIDSYLVRRPGAWRLTYFLPYAIPGLIAAIMWGYLYIPEVSPFAQYFPTLSAQPFFLSPEILILSMANMTTWTFTGYNMLIFLAALQAIPHDLYEAARIDGATGWQITTKIKIPLVRGAALLAVLLSIIGTVQLFNEPTIMSKLASWIPNTYMPMMMAYNTNYGRVIPEGAGPASAISLLMAVVAGVLAVIYALIQKKAD